MRQKLILLTACCVLLLSLVGWLSMRKFTQAPPTNPVVLGISKQPVVTARIVFESTSSTSTNITATTPYEALLVVSKEHHIEVKAKQYDMGVFVEGIGGVYGSNQYAWIYSVNGVNGTDAADKTQVKSGDVVEWKYLPLKF